MATNAPQDDWHKTGLRLPKDLHHALHEAAAASGRSYNGEIVARLQQSFEPAPHASADAAYLIRRWSRDISQAAVNEISLKMKLGTYAATIVLWADKVLFGEKINEAELKQWHRDAEIELRAAVAAQDETVPAIQQLNETQKMLVELQREIARPAAPRKEQKKPKEK